MCPKCVLSLEHFIRWLRNFGLKEMQKRSQCRHCNSICRHERASGDHINPILYSSFWTYESLQLRNGEIVQVLTGGVGNNHVVFFGDLRGPDNGCRSIKTLWDRGMPMVGAAGRSG